jgi:acyl carrier protein
MNIELRDFLIRRLGVEEEEIMPQARIEEDLGVWGDDAVDLIIEFGKRFKVNVSNFMAADYFSPDGDRILPAIFRMLTGKKQKKHKALTIYHLDRAINEGRLDEDVINAEKRQR